jgi:hypothetical protein
LNGGFDHDQFKKFLGDGIMRYEAINHDHSVFSIAFIKKNTKEELEKILNVDFNIYHIAE